MTCILWVDQWDKPPTTTPLPCWTPGDGSVCPPLVLALALVLVLVLALARRPRLESIVPNLSIARVMVEK